MASTRTQLGNNYHLRPTQTELWLRVAIKTAYIGSDQRNAEEVEVEDADDRSFEIDPSRRVVTQPMTPVLTGVREGGARNDERSILGFDAVRWKEWSLDIAQRG